MLRDGTVREGGMGEGLGLGNNLNGQGRRTLFAVISWLTACSLIAGRVVLDPRRHSLSLQDQSFDKVKKNVKT